MKLLLLIVNIIAFMSIFLVPEFSDEINAFVIGFNVLIIPHLGN